MTEVLDSFESRYPKGRGKAITLLILTSIGSLGRLAFASLIWYIVIGEHSMQYMTKDERFGFLTVTIVALCGLLNFAGSLVMFKRRRTGLWIYLCGQVITVCMITWCVLALSERLGEEEQVFLLIVYGITLVYSVLYLSNRKYYSSQVGQRHGNEM